MVASEMKDCNDWLIFIQTCVLTTFRHKVHHENMAYDLLYVKLIQAPVDTISMSSFAIEDI